MCSFSAPCWASASVPDCGTSRIAGCIPIEPPGTYPQIAPLLGKRVRTDVIRAHWDEVVRLVASLKAGQVAPSAMLRKLAAYERQNQLDVALQEIGKIERTLFMLDWLENPELRRRCQVGLNKSEQRHALTQAICTFRQGRIIDRSHEAQQYRASGLNLVIAAIVYWNSTYMADAVAHLRARGDSFRRICWLTHHRSDGSTSLSPATSSGIGPLRQRTESRSISRRGGEPRKDIPVCSAKALVTYFQTLLPPLALPEANRWRGGTQTQESDKTLAG